MKDRTKQIFFGLLVGAAIWLILIGLMCLLPGCSTGPLKPGRSATASSGLRAEFAQPENPAQGAAQTFEETIQRLPGRQTGGIGPGLTWTNNDGVIEIVTRKVTTQVGAAQKDSAREITARLASFRGIQWLGAVVFLFGAASLAWPPLKAVVGSVTSSGALILAGLALVFLPSLLAGHELIILCGIGALAGIWLLAHRHGHLKGLVDANKDGVDDRTQ